MSVILQITGIHSQFTHKFTVFSLALGGGIQILLNLQKKWKIDRILFSVQKKPITLLIL